MSRLSPMRLNLGALLSSAAEQLQLQRRYVQRRAGVGILAALTLSMLVTGSAAGSPSTPQRPILASSVDRAAPESGRGVESDRLGPPAVKVAAVADQADVTLPGPTTVPASEVTDLGIPDVALNAYRTAKASMDVADPGCRIDWSLIAGIGRVESDNGQSGGRLPAADGTVVPPILGIPLDGRPGVALIRDTDGGRLDFDTTYDRAVGPMQFIPGTWSAFPDADGDGNGVTDPHNLYDAALAAASYLCSGPGNLSEVAGQRSAIYRYNHSDSYVDLVLFYSQAYAAGVKPIGPPPKPAGPPPEVSDEPVDSPAHPGGRVPSDPAGTPTTDPVPPATTDPVPPATTDPVPPPTTDPVPPPTTDPVPPPTTDPVPPATTDPVPVPPPPGDPPGTGESPAPSP